MTPNIARAEIDRRRAWSELDRRMPRLRCLRFLALGDLWLRGGGYSGEEWEALREQRKRLEYGLAQAAFLDLDEGRGIVFAAWLFDNGDLDPDHPMRRGG